MIKVEKRSLKSRVKGRSSSVMRNILDEVWCILELFFSVADMVVSGGESEPLSKLV